MKTDTWKDAAAQSICVCGDLAAPPDHPQAVALCQKVEMIDMSYFRDS